MYKVYIEEIHNISKNKSLENIIKYANIEMKEVSLKSWSYLSHILKKDYDYDLSFDNIFYNKNNKPYLKNNKLFFNISHSKDMVAIVISDKECGIDIEWVNYNKSIEKIINKVLSLKELKSYNIRKDKVKYFYSKWTKKEAYFKKIGVGIEMNKLNSDLPLKNIKTKVVKNKKEKYILSCCVE